MCRHQGVNSVECVLTLVDGLPDCEEAVKVAGESQSICPGRRCGQMNESTKRNSSPHLELFMGRVVLRMVHPELAYSQHKILKDKQG